MSSRPGGSRGHGKTLPSIPSHQPGSLVLEPGLPSPGGHGKRLFQVAMTSRHREAHLPQVTPASASWA